MPSAFSFITIDMHYDVTVDGLNQARGERQHPWRVTSARTIEAPRGASICVMRFL